MSTEWPRLVLRRGREGNATRHVGDVGVELEFPQALLVRKEPGARGGSHIRPPRPRHLNSNPKPECERRNP